MKANVSSPGLKHKKTFRTAFTSLRQLFILLVILTFLVGPAATTPVQAQSAYAWTAYNDCYWETGQPNANISQVRCSTDNATGSLVKHADNTATGVTVAVDVNDLQTQSGTGFSADPQTGTDAYTTFNGIVSMVSGAKFNESSSYVTLTFNGLDPAKTYTFATSANRNSSGYTGRLTVFQLQNAVTAINASSSGVTRSTTVFPDDTATFSTGYNTVNGYVARWTGIQPSPGGSFVLRATSSTEASIPAVFMLAEEQATGPRITTTGTLSAFNSQPGVPSPAQTYSVSGSLLTQNISISAPAGFEISTDGTSYSPSLTLTQTGGTVAATTIHVRLNHSSLGTYSGNITHTSSPADPVNIAVSGEVATVPQCTTVNLTSTADTRLRGSQATTNFGGETTVQMNANGTSWSQVGLFRWDLNSIPASAEIESASITFNVTDASTTQFPLYRLRRDWVEGSATWNTYNGTSNWGTAGARNTTSDRYDTNLWGTTAINATGSQTRTLNTSGISVLEDWLSTPTSNFGVTIQNTATSDDYLIVSSKEAANAADRPQLNINYCMPSTDPTITTTGTLSAFTSQPGVPSPAQTYSVSGSLLTQNISINAPAGFELSTDGTSYSSSLTLTQTGGTVAATTIYVRLNSANLGSISGNITHTSSGAAPVNIAVSGTVANTATVTFRNGESGYTGAIDTFIRGTTNGSTNYSTDVGLEWDENSGSTTDEITLIRFTNLFVSEGGPIPNGATILSASLQYRTSNITGQSTSEGDPANVYESLVDWPGSTVTWNNFGGEAGVQTDEYYPTLVDSALATAANTAYATDVASSLQRWSDDTAENFGWIFIPTADDGVTVHSSDVTTVANRPLLSVTYTTGAVNAAPAAPVLVQPADNATSVVTAPSLQVTVSDPNPDDTLNVSFYGREAGASGTAEDFMMVFIPDSQNASQFAPAQFDSQTQWIADNKDDENIVFVTHLGDVVNTSSSAAQYIEADEAISILDDGEVWYTVAPGNHDLGTGSLYPTYFGRSRYDNYLYANGFWFGGGYDDYNTYSLFSASGNDFILINLQYSPSTAVIDWADALLKTHSDRRGIITQHNILNIDNSWNSQTSFNALRDNPNLFMMLCGHMHSSSDGAAYREETGTDNHIIHIVQADYQDMNNGNGWLRLLRFSPANDMIYMTTYSPFTDAYRTDSPDQMDLAYDMDGEGAADFELIGTAPDVANGGTASITWNGLAAGTEYEWYAVANDGSLGTDSATWSFTTASAANQPPVITQGASSSVTMSEDGSPNPFSLTLNATDPNAGDTLTWSITTEPTHGTAAASGTGTSRAVTYAPNPDFNGSDSFIVQVADNHGGVDTITVNVTINAVNDAPVAVNDTYSTNWNTTFTVNAASGVLNNDTDAEAQVLTAAKVTDPAHGTLTLNTNGSFTYVPAGNWTGTDSFTYRASDGSANSSNATVTIEVTAGQVPPLPSSFYGEIHILDNPPTAGETIEVSVPGMASAFSAVIATEESELTYSIDILGDITSTAGKEGGAENDVLTFRIDGRVVATGVWHSGTNIELNIHPPQPVPGGPYAGTENTAINFSGSANDWGTDAATYQWDWQNDGTYDTTGQNPSRTWTSAGSYTVGLRVTDAQGGEGVTTFPVTITNGAPVLAEIGNRTVNELVQLAFTATATDTGTLTYSLIDAPTGATINASTGAFAWTPTEAQGPGSHSITVRVCDNGTPSLCDSETITVTVNEANVAPVLANIGNRSIDELAALAFTATATDADLPQNTLTYSLTGAPPAGASITTAGAFTWTPTEAQGPGSYNITVRVCDGGSLCDEEQITITVNEVNVDPVLGSIGNRTVDELTALTFTATASDSDVPANTYTFSLGNAPEGASITTAGVFTWTPTEAQGPANHTFPIQVCDNGTPSLCDSETITVTVNEVNVAPVLANIGDLTVTEETLLTFTAAATDADLPANTFTFSLVGAPSGASINSASGAFTWTPTEAQGPDDYDFTVEVCDNGTPSQCDSETITVTVTETNVPPALATIGDRSTDELAVLTFTATAIDSGTLTYSLEDAPAGAAIVASTGVFTWTPTEAQGPGTFDLTVRVCDTAALCDEEEITITVNEVNAEPVLASIGDRTIAELAALTFTASASDSDQPANTLTYSLEDAPTGASIDAATGAFTWTPTEAQGPGPYDFTVMACDNGVPQQCGQEEITVTVSEVNTAPVLGSIEDQTVVELSMLTFTATVTDADLPTNTFTFSLDGEPTGASIDALTGVFTWVPTDAQGPGTYDFTVSVCDNGSLCDDQEITVTINTSTLSHSVSLVAGWNLVSFDLIPEDTAIAEVLSTIAGNYDLVYAWDATGESADSGNWLKYAPTGPAYQNTLETLDETMGFWVHMTSADILEVTGTLPVETSITLTTLAEGWNLVGYPSQVDRALPGALVDNGVGTNFTLVYTYHAEDTADPWKLYDRTAPAWANDLPATTSGNGYWIFVSAESTWVVDYTLP